MQIEKSVFLPMTEEAMDCIESFMDPSYINEVFRFYTYRDEKGFGENPHEVYRQSFNELSGKEGEFRYRVGRMKKELRQLYENTPLSYHNKIQRHIEKCVADIKSATKQKNVIEHIKTLNLYKAVRFWDSDGEIYETPTRRQKSEKFDLTLVSNPYFEEYQQLLQKLVLIFQFEVSIFLPKPEADEEDLPDHNKDQQDFSKDSLFLLTGPEYYVADPKRLKEICEKYSEEALKKVGSKCFIEREGDGYLWLGQGDNIIPLLAKFINRLIAIRVVRKRKKRPLARFFLHYFRLSDTYPNPHFLSTIINLDSSPEDISNPFHPIR